MMWSKIGTGQVYQTGSSINSNVGPSHQRLYHSCQGWLCLDFWRSKLFYEKTCTAQADLAFPSLRLLIIGCDELELQAGGSFPIVLAF
jgi:hypothetical protein